MGPRLGGNDENRKSKPLHGTRSLVLKFRAHLVGIDAAAFPALRKTGSKLIDSSTFFQNGSDRSVSPHEIQRLFNEAVFYKRAVLPQ